MQFQNAEFVGAYGSFPQLPPCSRMEIAFAGRSNVGKSTLINKLFNRKSLARVSAVPGKTATINFYQLEGVHFVDLPGYGYAKVAKSEKERWAGLIEGYLNSERDIRLVFLLIDMRHAPSADDLHMISYLVEAELPFVIILTKADKLKKMARQARMEAFAEEIPYYSELTVIPFSAQTREGVEQVRQIITELAEEDKEED
ncbi:ribosome biogenesis GTP-binding protein YihA/YsxC [Ruminococcus sp.]|uniref:ribosome biogenesis GTP-binding protein YihA/YsxC n=1 Tax=Ruminococcus sp. TaxID=41978 RepID=UPI0025F09092|nr:ribosome biogenesis GTP-binding protein YihA/YsxC [Ruminococcus sp.]MCI5816633.1 ribosome biogenesis GTP-binding protein YihA/YsxC [Ruminococcus sp.]MDD7556798.1 ribosome biogenesis GTP-binding protein YihA/YsxC [Ruminococcus sp.]MDY4963055.1 ribosome biogenesis GTP-binding protein YihA/YsxC [Ruminococcus callidus]